MADLSTLDSAAPVGADPVSQGDDAIRATRDATKTSFGGSDSGTGTQASEHYLKGFHKFPNGTTAARPSAGNAGRIYLNTEHTWQERDDGSAWNLLNAVGFLAGTSTAGSGLTTSYANFSITTLSDMPAGSRVLVVAHVSVTPTTSGTETLVAKVLLDGSTMTPGEQTVTIPAGTGTTVNTVVLGVLTTTTSGSKSLALQLKKTSTISVTVNRAQLWALVL